MTEQTDDAATLAQGATARPRWRLSPAGDVYAVNHIEQAEAALAEALDAAQAVLDSCNVHSKYPTLVSPKSLAGLQRFLAAHAAPQDDVKVGVTP